MQHFDLSLLSEENANLCQGAVYPVGSFENVYNKPFVKITGSAKDALIINGENASCVESNNTRNDTRIMCANGSSSYNIQMQAPGNVQVNIKHNTEGLLQTT